jgi:large subunit ribosomal protein L25
VKALPQNLPDFIEADITEMRIGEKMYVTDVETDNFVFLHTDNTVICQVRTSRIAVEDEVDEDEEGIEGEEGEEGAEGEATQGAEGEAPAEE